MAEIPVLMTPRLVLRGRTLADFPAYAAMWDDPAVTRHIAPAPPTREDIWTKFARQEGFWALCGYGFWLVEERATGALVGEVGLADFRRAAAPPLDGKFECGWVIAACAQGKGYAGEAMQAALGFADAKFPGAVMSCIIDPQNAPSIRVAEKCGFLEFARANYKGSDIIVFQRRAS